MSCCTERSHGVLHSANIPVLGIQVPAVSIDPEALGNIYKALSVINDTDQDIRVEYITSEGVKSDFIVPKSIKGFTRALKGGVAIVNDSVKLYSLHATAGAVGNVTLNFGT